MQTIFTVLRYLTIKQKPELRLNGMVTPAIMDFRIFHFLLIWYDRAWQFISKKYNFFRYLSLKLEKLRQPVTIYIQTTTFCKGFPFPPSISVDGSANYIETMLQTHC